MADVDEATVRSDARPWRGLLVTGAWCAFASVVMIVVQVPIYVVWPPPESTEGFFELLVDNPVLGLVSLDVLYVVSNALMYLVYLALAVVLWRVSRSAVAIALAFCVVGIALMRAAVISSVLFGAFHLVNLAMGSSPVDVAFRFLYTALIGFAFAAPALVTGAIWPVILIHAVMDLANTIQASAPLAVAASASSPDLPSRFLTAIPNALLAAYGYWLLRRHLTHAAARNQQGAVPGRGR